MTRRLAAIVAVDVAGYSRLMGADEAGTLATLKAHRAETDALADRFGGRIVGTAGDGILFEFPSVIEAVNCAVAVQHRMAERNADVEPVRQMLYRIGVNLGDVMVDGDDIFGDGVNVAARLQERAEPGGICISDMVHTSVRQQIDETFDDIGEQRFKNIAQPVRVWVWTGQAAPALAAVTGAGGPPPLPDKPSIAVLPFDNMSSDSAQEFFADGLAEDIITTLSKISYLFVIARNSSFAYRGKSRDLRQVGRELGVRYVLEGSVRQSGNRLRVTAQLIEAASGSHVWAERYDRVLDDVFDLQDEMTREIVNALNVKLTDSETAAVWLRVTDNVEAWTATVQAMDRFLRFTPVENAAARVLLQRAVSLDPNYALAWAFLGFTHWYDAQFGFTENRDKTLEAIDQCGAKSLAADPDQPYAYAVRSMTCLMQGRSPEALSAAARAVALAPGNADMRGFLAQALAPCGRHDEAIEMIRSAMRLNPFYPVWYLTTLAEALARSGRADEAIEILEAAVAREPDHFMSHLSLASLYARLGRLPEAGKAIAEVLRIDPSYTVAKLNTTRVEADRTSSFVDGLRTAGLPE